MHYKIFKGKQTDKIIKNYGGENMTQPEKRFKVGSCTASIFVNEVNMKNGKVPMKSVSLQRSYKDSDGNFQNTTSFRENDIPKAVLALNKAYEYLVAGEKAE